MSNQIIRNELTFNVGDKIVVYYNIHEAGKKKAQQLEGIVLSTKGVVEKKMFCVRKMTKSKIGVERIFPVNSPFIDKIEIKRKATRVRRAKVYFVREKSERDITERLYRGQNAKS